MISSTVFLAAALNAVNAEELTAPAPAPMADAESEPVLVERELTDQRRLPDGRIYGSTAGQPIGGDWENQMPRWVRDPTFEKPQGVECVGVDCSSTRWYYTPEQQARLGVDRDGDDVEDGRLYGRRLDGWSADEIHYAGLLGVRLPASRPNDWGHDLQSIGGDWENQMPRFVRDPSFEMPEGEEALGSSSRWIYTAEQQARLGVDRDGEDRMPIGGDWENQIPRWILDPSFEKPAGTENLGTSTIAVYTPEQQARLGVDAQGKDVQDMPHMFGGRRMDGQCTCPNGSTGMLVSGGRCIHCEEPAMPGQCTCPNGSTGMLVEGGLCAGCQPMRGQCTCPNGSTGMLVEGGLCAGCQPRRGQCTCPNGSTGMLVSGGFCINCEEPAMPGQCTCPNGSTGMLVEGGQCVNCEEPAMPGQCTCSDGSTGMLVSGGQCVGCPARRPGQCECSDGSTGMLVSGGECVCDSGRLYGR